MNSIKPRVLFMGTPDFAAPALRAIIENNYPVKAVVTQPDRPKGRGMQLSPPPVKIMAERLKIPVLQPARVRDEKFIDRFRELNPDIVVVAAFGQILPPEIIELPKFGCINVHPSLLPKYRGAAPLNWQLIRGETMTGITIMYMGEGVDSGDILLQEETPLGAEETAGELHDRLSLLGSRLLLKTMEEIAKGNIKRIPQDHNLATFAPRLKKADGRINWNKNAAEIVNLIRGLSPAPCAYTTLNGKAMKIFRARAETKMALESPGTIVLKAGHFLTVTAADGCVHLLDIQMENKKRMTGDDFLRGYRIPPGAVMD